MGVVTGIPLFTSFVRGRQPGILDWYTGLVGLFALAALAGHGALYLAWRTAGPVRERSLLTASNAISARYAMGVALVWWADGMALVACYFTYLFRSMRGKVGADQGAS
jgi:cytochrome bd-type quinol oxidase subunit 2